MKESEANIQKAILDWGKVMRIPMRRMNVIGTPTKDGFRPAPNRGMADIHCELIIAGIPVSVWLEVKINAENSHSRKKPSAKGLTVTVDFISL